MKTRLQVVIGVVLIYILLSPLNSLAANNFYSMQDFQLWSNTYEWEVIRVIDLNGTQNPEGCSDPDSYFVSQSLSLEAQNRIYSTLLAAKLSGLPIQVVLNGCENTKPRITNVILQ